MLRNNRFYKVSGKCSPKNEEAFALSLLKESLRGDRGGGVGNPFSKWACHEVASLPVRNGVAGAQVAKGPRGSRRGAGANTKNVFTF